MEYAHVSISPEHASEAGKDVYVKSDGVQLHEILEEAGVIPMGYATSRPSYKYVYRKMGLPEYHASVEKQQLPPPLGGNQRTAEKWVSESLDHTRNFNNAGVGEAPQATVEIGLDKGDYSKIRDQSIPQRGSRQHQPARGKPFNVTNTEHLDKYGGNKVNIGIKGSENLDEFNKAVVKIQKVDEHGFMNQTKHLRWIRRYKLAAVASLIGVAIDAASITLAVIDDGGKFGPSTTVALSEIGTGVAGSVIGAALLSFCPVVGTIVGGLIGGFIGNLIGKGISRLIFGVRSVARGPGPPPLDTKPHPQGTPGVHVAGRGAPSLGHRTGSRGAPSTGHNIAMGAPK